MIKRVLSLFLILSIQLWAIQYKPTVLELEAKIFPKMILLNSKLNKKAETLTIYIITKEWDLYTADELKGYINFYYPKKISGKKIVVSIEEFKDFKKLPDAIIVLKHNKQEFIQIANWANKKGIVSLAYDPCYMEYGILASLYIGKSTKPYLNKEIIQKYGFEFNPQLLKLSKFR
jgi:hypothetical protein